MPPMEWVKSILDAVMANIAASLVLVVLAGIAGAVLGTLLFGQNYKQRIAALESRISQPMIVNNVFAGNRSATELSGAVTEIRVLTQAEYDALARKNETTLYLIVDKR